MNSLKQRLPRFSVLRSPFSLICASALLLAGVLEVRAATFTIDEAETLTNGGKTLTSAGGEYAGGIS